MTVQRLCDHCGQWGERIAEVPHRGRFGNGHRAKTSRRPLCSLCAVTIAARYNLDTDPPEAPHYFVEGWQAVGVAELARSVTC
jgi:hypothetical protein